MAKNYVVLCNFCLGKAEFMKFLRYSSSRLRILKNVEYMIGKLTCTENFHATLILIVKRFCFIIADDMRRRFLLHIFFILSVAINFPPRAAAETRVLSLKSLLDEMVDYERIARRPAPEYFFKQFSSFDRNSKSPDNPLTWFANIDNTDGMGGALRREKNQGRLEWVFFESDGPGAIVRMWFGGKFPKGTIRFYFDGSATPGMEAPLYEFSTARGFVPGPFSMETALTPSGGGMNVYLPIPFARRLKITYDEMAPIKLIPRTPSRWYHIDYRLYPKEVPVRTFSMAEYNSSKPELIAAGKVLLNPLDFSGGKKISEERVLEPGREFRVDLAKGPAAVRALEIQLKADDMSKALRALAIRISFDDEETVFSPVGDFFGSGKGLNELASWYRTVSRDGVMKCRWVMPFQSSARVTIVNYGKQPANVRLSVSTGDWDWDQNSMYFHANWHAQYPVPTRPFKDWNYITITGKGLYVGDALSVYNPVKEWWGEGDEKIYVDGEDFPSVFGTGTEDYYGYSWGGTKLFQTPFTNQVRVDGPKNKGNTVDTRTRNLDAVPFSKSLKFDMEIWHWSDCNVSYAVTTYWYGLPGASCNIKTSPENLSAPLPGDTVK